VHKLTIDGDFEEARDGGRALAKESQRYHGA
jgi:hypothetical protein